MNKIDLDELILQDKLLKKGFIWWSKNAKTKTHIKNAILSCYNNGKYLEQPEITYNNPILYYKLIKELVRKPIFNRNRTYNAKNKYTMTRRWENLQKHTLNRYRETDLPSIHELLKGYDKILVFGPDIELAQFNKLFKRINGISQNIFSIFQSCYF